MVGEARELRGGVLQGAVRAAGHEVPQGGGHLGHIGQLRRRGRERVLPGLRGRGENADAPRVRAHVARDELVPGVGEGLVQLLRVRGEGVHRSLEGRVLQEGQVRGHHHDGHALRAVVDRGRHGRLVALGHAPLVRAARPHVLLEVLLLEVGEVLIVPGGRVRGPGALDARGEGVGPLAAPAAARPGLVRALLGARPGARGARAVRLAKRVSAPDQCHGLSIVHGHARKGGPYVRYGPLGVGLALVALGVHVDEAHGRGAQGGLAVAALRAREARLLLRRWAQGEAFRAVPVVGAPRAEAQGGAAHVLDGRGSGQHDEVPPGEPHAVLCLDRLQ
mmetsp:Transcript_23161/g.77755  ORF Transcript_23161/g.77755 Transcript_23161/m.77755 type:complete len:334 (+) Transcript_23161:982-1983(+)